MLPTPAFAPVVISEIIRRRSNDSVGPMATIRLPRMYTNVGHLEGALRDRMRSSKTAMPWHVPRPSFVDRRLGLHVDPREVVGEEQTRFIQAREHHALWLPSEKRTTGW
jgi:hypothetical protein